MASGISRHLNPAAEQDFLHFRFAFLYFSRKVALLDESPPAGNWLSTADGTWHVPSLSWQQAGILPFLFGEAPSISLHAKPAAEHAFLHFLLAFGYFTLNEAVFDEVPSLSFGLSPLDKDAHNLKPKKMVYSKFIVAAVWYD